jgi:hypothetical protein
MMDDARGPVKRTGPQLAFPGAVGAVGAASLHLQGGRHATRRHIRPRPRRTLEEKACPHTRDIRVAVREVRAARQVSLPHASKESGNQQDTSTGFFWYASLHSRRWPGPPRVPVLVLVGVDGNCFFPADRICSLFSVLAGRSQQSSRGDARVPVAEEVSFVATTRT